MQIHYLNSYGVEKFYSDVIHLAKVDDKYFIALFASGHKMKLNISRIEGIYYQNWIDDLIICLHQPRGDKYLCKEVIHLQNVDNEHWIVTLHYGGEFTVLTSWIDFIYHDHWKEHANDPRNRA